MEALDHRWLPSQVGLTVSSLADSGPGTLRGVILTADAGSPSDKFTIGFGVSGTIDLQTPLPDLNNSIAIQGPGASSLTLERATGYSFTSAIVTVDAGQTASLSGLTVANGDDGGVWNHEGTLTVSDCTLSANYGQSTSALANYGGTTTIVGSTFSGNSSGFFGGAVFNTSTGTAVLTITSSTLSGNSSAEGGGAIFNFGTLTVGGTTVSGNSAPFGGGIANNSGASLTVDRSTVTGNSALFTGGGIDNSFGGTLTVTDSTLSDNSAPLGGGAISNEAAGATVASSILSGNSATRGGAIANVSVPGFQASVLTVRDSLLVDNTATMGGAIENDVGQTVDVRGCAVSCNSAGDRGGGIDNAGTANIQGSTLSGNSAGSGGGLFNAASGTLTVQDSTVLSNSAPLGGDLYNAGLVVVDDSTIGDRYDV
jgi:hypothetical protein